MATSFKYVPKYRDIRVRPPEPEKARPSERRCEWSGCVRTGQCRAPKGPGQLREFYWFCGGHAAEYNRSWNFFEGMSAGEMKAFQESATYGHRPTWGFKGRRADAAARGSHDWTAGFTDPFGMFGDQQPPRRPSAPPMSRLQKNALQTLRLQGRPTAQQIREKYRELIKQLHPDANAGDRSTEDQLQAVIRAYQTLKTTGMA
jgi:hypothetical protein